MMIQRQDHIKKIEQKKKNKQDAGLVSERYPAVDGMVIHMTYLHKAENPVLMERTVNVFPSSYAYFNMECMTKGCEGGGFDLSPIIARNVKQQKKSVKGSMVCKGKSEDRSADHASISYEISIKYARKKPKRSKK
ncbi:MAG: hypothetical protein JSU90_07855 [Nitrospiraceae bacterium]|nr:MAG: hypothetical protein JSU90_07855 [Nitrospiraceae bacterium]